MAKQTVAVDGVEHVVETGEGHVTVLDAPKNINARVEINDERPAMKFPLKAWLDTRDVGLWEFAQKANTEGLRITYRIETHRDGDIDPSIPIADVEPMKKFRRLVKLTSASAQNAQPEQQTSIPSRPQQARPVAPEPVSDDYDPGPQDEYGGTVSPPVQSLRSTFEDEFKRLSTLLDAGLRELRNQSINLAECEREYRKFKAQKWVEAPTSPNRSEWTSDQRLAWVDAESADLRYERDLADGMRTSALEAVRTRRAQLSALQSLLSAEKAEAELAKYGPGMAA